MVVENLKVFKVKSYKELFKLYKNRKLGITEQRMPENLCPLKPSETLSELECIQSLLETDFDFPYHVYFDGEKYIISILGFSVSKIIDGYKQLIQFGEDGVWQEQADYSGITDSNDESNLEWEDASNHSFEMWGMNHLVKKHETQNLKQFFKDKTLYIKDGDQLEEFREILIQTNLSVRMGYDDSYSAGEGVSCGYMHRVDNRFYLSKNSFLKKETTFNEVLNIVGLKYDDVKRKDFN